MVVMIMAIMLAVAVPIVRPPVEARTVREAARMVNTALASARTRAIQTGRPVGVMFEPSDAAGNNCATLHYVQVAAPWSGPGTVTGNVFAGLGSYASGGGVLKLNYQGPTYDVTSGNYLAVPVPGLNDGNYDFQFYPPPKKSSLFPLQLPTRAVVDIGASGIGDSHQFPASGTPPKIPVTMVTFAPTGAVDDFYSGGISTGLADSLYLLVGKPGKTDYTASDKEENNLLDGDNIWIKLDYRTGAVSSAENKPSANVEDARDFIIDG